MNTASQPGGSFPRVQNTTALPREVSSGGAHPFDTTSMPDARQPELSPSHRQPHIARGIDGFQSFLQECMDRSDGGGAGLDWDQFQRFLVRPGAGITFDAFRSTTLSLTINSSDLKAANMLLDQRHMKFSQEIIDKLNETVAHQTLQLMSPTALVGDAIRASPQMKVVRESRALLPLTDRRGGDQCFPQALVMTFQRTDGHDVAGVGEDTSKLSTTKSTYAVGINVKMMRVIASPDFEFETAAGGDAPNRDHDVIPTIAGVNTRSGDSASHQLLEQDSHSSDQRTCAGSIDRKGSPPMTQVNKGTKKQSRARKVASDMIKTASHSVGHLVSSAQGSFPSGKKQTQCKTAHGTTPATNAAPSGKCRLPITPSSLNSKDSFSLPG